MTQRKVLIFPSKSYGGTLTLNLMCGASICHTRDEETGFSSKLLASSFFFATQCWHLLLPFLQMYPAIVSAMGLGPRPDRERDGQAGGWWEVVRSQGGMSSAGRVRRSFAVTDYSHISSGGKRRLSWVNSAKDSTLFMKFGRACRVPGSLT